MAEKVYVKGFRSFPKSENAPDFVLGTLVITLDDFKEFVNGNHDLLTEYNGKKQLRCQVLKGLENRLNIVVDTFKPKAKENEASNDLPEAPQRETSNDIDPLPF